MAAREKLPDMWDIIIVATLAGLFAATVTAHVAILVGLIRRRPRWHALAALLVPVLAPIWAFAEGMRVRGTVWCAGLVLYVLALALAR